MTPDQFHELVGAIVAALKTEAGPAPQMFDQPDAWVYVGLSRTAWFRLRSAGELPEPVNVPGAGLRWRRKDLDHWIDKIKPKRVRRVVKEVRGE